MQTRNQQKIFGSIIFFNTKQKQKTYPPPGGLEPPTFRLTAERANRLRHGGGCLQVEKT